MGNFLNSLKIQSHKNEDFLSFFHRISLTKLQEYYSLFKSISQTYSIDHEQFTQLLGNADINTDQLFECLDTDHNLLIDGLQFFSALALLSNNISFENKIKFLFNLFDFNALRSLSRTDIQFLVLSCCNSISKIFMVFYEEEFVEQFAKEEFPREERVNISQILKWGGRSESVENFFRLIGHAFEKDDSTLLDRKIFLNLQDTKRIPNNILQSLNNQQQAFIQRNYKLLKDPTEQEILEPLVESFELNPKPNWIYGLRYKDVKQFLQFKEDQLIYYVGKVVILYDVKAHTQRFYRGHRHQIISIATGGQLCASGQYAPQPQIKVWNRRTLQTVSTLRGHRRGIHLVMFMNELLVSCGCFAQSPILVHSIETGQVIYSTYCNNPAVDISPLVNFTAKGSQQFVVCHLKGVDHFIIDRTDPQPKVISQRFKQIEKGRLTCVCYFMMNKNLHRLSDYDEQLQKHLLVGYQSGNVQIWELESDHRISFSQQPGQILSIVPTQEALFIASDSSFIKVYDIRVSQFSHTKTVDFTQVDKSLLSYNILDINHTGSQLLVVTQDGQIVFLQTYKGKEMPSLTYLTHQEYHIRKVDDILAIEGEIKAQKLILKQKEEHLYIIQDCSIKAISMSTHQYIFEWNIGQPVKAFDAALMRNGSLLMIAATQSNAQNGRLCSFSDLKQNTAVQTVQGQILSILLIVEEYPFHLIVLVSTRMAIYKYGFVKNGFLKIAYLPINDISARLSNLQSGRVLLNSKQNVLQTVSVGKQNQQMHIQAIDDNMLDSDKTLKFHFYLGTVSESQEVLVGIVGRRAKGIIVSRWDGSIHIWGGYDQLIQKNGLLLSGHTATVGDLSLSEDQRYLISGGSKDGMVVEWRLDLCKESNSAILPSASHQDYFQKSTDPATLRKIQFCMFSNDILTSTYDQHLRISGIKYQSVKRLFKSPLSDWRNINRSTQPGLSLRLDFVFGIQTFHKNNTVILLDQPKRVLYFVGRLVVVYNPALNNQGFYRGHKYKVTCLVVTDNKQNAISGEAAYLPILNLWNITTLETLRVIRTTHQWGIIELSVHRTILLSFGFRQKRLEDEQGQHPLYSFQLHDLETGFSLAEGSQKKMVNAMCLDPSNSLRFVACTQGRVTFWSVVANSIVKKSVCHMEDTPTACLFYGEKGQPDLLVGTKSGAIGMVVRQRYWHIFERGDKHTRQVNCLLVVKPQKQPLILVSSEDNLLRVLGSTFQQKLRINMMKEEVEMDRRMIGENNRSLQSLGVIDQKELILLGGTRNGQIVEVALGKQLKLREVGDTMIIRFSGGDGSQGKGKALLAHHPKYQVSATLGQDQVVIFWDCDRRKLLHVYQLGLDKKTKPTVLKFSHNGDYLIIGFSDGLLVFLDSKISKAMQGRGDEKYSLPSLKTVVKEKYQKTQQQGKREREEKGDKKDRREDVWSVVGIEISQHGQFMAVSYHRLNEKRSIAQVKIYSSKLVGHKLHRPTKLDNQKVYQMHSRVDNPHLDHVYRTTSGLTCGFAVVAMTFAEYEGSHYLLMFFQLVDQNQNKIQINEGSQDLKYKIRHVNNKTDSANTSSLNQLIRWKKPHLFGALGANYLIYQRGFGETQNNHLRLPLFTGADLLEGHLVLGSQNGDIHLIGASLVESGGVASTIPAHCCKINQLEHSFDRTVLYTTGQNDHTVLRWIIDTNSNPPALQAMEDKCDLFAEIPQEEHLMSRMAVYQQNFMRPRHHWRKLVHAIKLHDVVGRRAYNMRNNLKTDKRGRVVYHSGQAVVVTDLKLKTKEFLYLEGKMAEEVSQLEMSSNGQLLVVAYAGVKPAICLWSLSSKLLLSTMHLEQIIRIIYISISHDNSRLLLYTLRGKEAQGCIMLLDLVNQTLLATATYIHKQNWQVKALTFSPESYDRFVTCGVEPVKLWQYGGGQLVYTALPSPDPNRIYTCLVFAGDMLITGTEEGQLILWREEPIIYSAHQEMVTCLTTSTDKQGHILIASGSQAHLEGDIYQIVLWVLAGGELRQLQQVSARRDMLTHINMLGGRVSSRYQSQLQIQSLSFKQNRLIIGLLKGDVFQYEYLLDGIKSQTGQAELLMAFQDAQCTKSLFFTQNSQRLVDISQHGLLRVWKFPRQQLLWCRNFETQVVDMLYSTVNQLVLIGFRGQLRFLTWSDNHKSLQQLSQRSIQFNFLTHLLLSHNQKLLALGIESNSDKSNLIEVYDLGVKEFKMKLRMKFQNGVQYIDFNRNINQKNFILIKTVQRLQLIDLNTMAEISSHYAGKQEWIGQGLQIADKTKKARELHRQLAGQGLAIRKIAELGKYLLIVDSSGGVYLFQDGQLLDQSPLNISGIESATVSPNGRWLGVASLEDRNIVIFELSAQ